MSIKILVIRICAACPFDTGEDECGFPGPPLKMDTLKEPPDECPLHDFDSLFNDKLIEQMRIREQEATSAARAADNSREG
jgi:hypothetical protein